ALEPPAPAPAPRAVGHRPVEIRHPVAVEIAGEELGELRPLLVGVGAAWAPTVLGVELLTLVGLLEPVLSEDEDEVVAVGEEAVRLALVAPLLGEASDYVVDVGHAASHELVDGAREPRLRRVGQGDGVADPKVEAPAPGDR